MLGSWGHGVMGSWGHGVMGSWGHGVKGSWSHGVMGSWGHGVKIYNVITTLINTLFIIMHICYILLGRRPLS